MNQLLREISQGRSDLVKLRPQDIAVEDSYNVRIAFNQDAIREIKASILEHGCDVVDPITIEMVDGKPTLRAGHTRHAAAMELIAEGHEVPYLKAIPKRFNEQSRVIDLLLSNNNTPLNGIEQGEVFKKLRDQGLSLDEIAQKTAKSVAHISNCITLAEAPQEAKMLVAVGKMSSSTLLDIVRKHKKDEKIIERANSAVEAAQKQGKAKATGKTLAKEKFGMSVELYNRVMKAIVDSDTVEPHEVQLLDKILRKSI